MANDKSYRALSEYFYDTCGSCSRMFPNTGKCSYVSYRHKLNEPVRDCRKYDGPVSPDKRDYAEVYRLMTGRRYYYILTAIFEILGIDPETSAVYQSIKNLIRKVRQSDKNVKEAVHYDTYGEELAEALVRDTNATSICNKLLVDYLSLVYVMIKEGKEIEAINTYARMVNYLQIRYQNNVMIPDFVFEGNQELTYK